MIAEMFAVFLTPAYAPFAVALVVMLGIGLIEAAGLGLGHFDLHGHAGAEPDGDAGDALEWLGIGTGLPILIWLTALLACFTISGIAIQQIVTASAGRPLGGGIAAGLALVAGGVLNRFVAGGLARIMPGYESTAIPADALLMRRGTVLEGTARRGRPARAKVVDQFRQAHYVMIEPHNDEDAIGQGETALLVRKEGAIFFALPDEHESLRLP